MENTPIPTKPWYESKTIWIALIQAVIAVVIVVSTQYPAIGGLLVLKSILDILNRFVTGLPIA